MRAYAVIPPILLDKKRRSYRYANRNGLVEDALCEHKERKNVNLWTEQEGEIFKEKYLQHPKNFVVIASYLERKSVSDCIQNYYLSKKKENYKLLVKRRMRRPRNKGNNQPSVDNLVSINSSTGVTTRGSAAAAQKELMKNGSSVSSSSLMASTSSSGMEESGLTVNGTTITMTSHTNTNWLSSSSTSSCSTSMSSSIAASSANDGSVSVTVAIASGDGDSSTIISSNHAPVTSHAVNASSPPTTEESLVNSSSSTCSITSNTISSSVVDSTSLSNCQEVREKDKENLSVIR